MKDVKQKMKNLLKSSDKQKLKNIEDTPASKYESNSVTDFKDIMKDQDEYQYNTNAPLNTKQQTVMTSQVNDCINSNSTLQQINLMMNQQTTHLSLEHINTDEDKDLNGSKLFKTQFPASIKQSKNNDK